MTSARTRTISELADKMKTRVFVRLPVYTRRNYRIYSRIFLEVFEKYLEMIAVYAKLDGGKNASLPSDDGVTLDRLVHGATVGSLAVIAISIPVLLYGMASAVIGFGSTGQDSIVETTEAPVPAWSPNLAESPHPASGQTDPLSLGGEDQPPSTTTEAPGDKTAWTPTVSKTAATEPEQGSISVAALPASDKPEPPTADEDRFTALKLYDQHASHYATGEYSKLWNAIDPTCVFIDEKGKRQTVKELRPLSQQFFSSIRNARVKYKIHNYMVSGDTMVTHVESEMRFDLKSQLLFLEEWSPHIKTEIALDIWKKKANGWKIVETRTLRPETLRTGTKALKRPPAEKAVAYPTNACNRTCAETVVNCSGVPVDTVAPKRNCATEYNACMAGCRD